MTTTFSTAQRASSSAPSRRLTRCVRRSKNRSTYLDALITEKEDSLKDDVVSRLVHGKSRRLEISIGKLINVYAYY